MRRLLIGGETFPDGQLFVDLRGFYPDDDPVDPLTAVRGFLSACGVEIARLGGWLADHIGNRAERVVGALRGMGGRSISDKSHREPRGPPWIIRLCAPST